MIPELALFALIVSALLAAYQTWLGAFAYQQQQSGLLALVQRCTAAQGLLVLTSFALLVFCFVQNDFSLPYVAEHSHLDLPWYYRFSASWGAHEGSMLLWLLILVGWQNITAFSRGLDRQNRLLMLAVMGLISLGFTGFVLLTSNPFVRDFSLIHSVGQDLNPLLQDPGLIIHPPILYLGYVGTSLAFALAVAILIRGQYQPADFIWLRKWLLLSWAFLTAGITLGSWWAYRVLGWGGWWFWDPVENASFLPWLAGTALIHALVIVRQQGAFCLWVCFLCLTVFALSILGTFLVRSGVLTSVHSFAADPSRGVYILGLFALLIGSAMLLFIYRLNHWPATVPEQFFSKQSFLLVNSILLFCLMLAVLTGTLFPLLMEIVNGTQYSVGAPYFNLIFTPFALLCLALMALVWCNHVARKWASYWLIPSFLASLGVVLGIVKQQGFPWLLLIGLTLSIWVFLVTSMIYRQSKTKKARQSFSFAAFCSHLGIIVLALGVILSSTFSQQQDVRMGLTESVALGPYEFNLDSMKGIHGPNYQAMRLNFTINKISDGSFVAHTHAEKRLYAAQNTLLSHPGIVPGVWRDFYVAIGEAIPPKEWTIRLYYKPFVRWIWLGGVIILLGGVAGFMQIRPRCRSQEQVV